MSPGKCVTFGWSVGDGREKLENLVKIKERYKDSDGKEVGE